MSMVRFAMLCDKCGKRSDEYSVWDTCFECMEDVCDDCLVPGSRTEDERGECLCKRCHIIAAVAFFAAHPLDPERVRNIMPASHTLEDRTPFDALTLPATPSPE